MFWTVKNNCMSHTIRYLRKSVGYPKPGSEDTVAISFEYSYLLKHLNVHGSFVTKIIIAITITFTYNDNSFNFGWGRVVS